VAKLLRKIIKIVYDFMAQSVVKQMRVPCQLSCVMFVAHCQLCTCLSEFTVIMRVAMSGPKLEFFALFKLDPSDEFF